MKYLYLIGAGRLHSLTVVARIGEGNKKTITVDTKAMALCLTH